MLAFLGLITAALGSSCWLFASQSFEQMSDMIGQQAKMMAYTLSLAGAAVDGGRQAERSRRHGPGVAQHPQRAFVAFLDGKQQPIALANRYEDFNWSNVSPLHPDTEALYMIHPRSSASFGDFVDVYAPIYSRRSTDSTDPKVARVDGDDKPIGFVVVGVSLDREQAQLYL